VYGNQLSDTPRSRGTRFCRGFHRSDVSANQHGDPAVEQIFPAHHNNICGLDHGVGSLNSTNQTTSFDKTEGFHA
jgi:hypothetical protein